MPEIRGPISESGQQPNNTERRGLYDGANRNRGNNMPYLMNELHLGSMLAQTIHPIKNQSGRAPIEILQPGAGNGNLTRMVIENLFNTRYIINAVDSKLGPDVTNEAAKLGITYPNTKFYEEDIALYTGDPVDFVVSSFVAGRLSPNAFANISNQMKVGATWASYDYNVSQVGDPEVPMTTDMWGLVNDYYELMGLPTDLETTLPRLLVNNGIGKLEIRRVQVPILYGSVHEQSAENAVNWMTITINGLLAQLSRKLNAMAKDVDSEGNIRQENLLGAWQNKYAEWSGNINSPEYQQRLYGQLLAKLIKNKPVKAANAIMIIGKKL